MKPIYQIPNMMGAPSMGARALPLSFDFDAAPIYAGDLMQENESGEFDFAQSIWIDNSQSADEFAISFPGIGEEGLVVRAAPYSQGFYPVTVPQGIIRYAATGGGQIDCILYNVPMPYVTWTVQSEQSGPSVGTWTNFAGVGTGADQIAIPANPDRLNYIIQNPSTNNDSIFVNYGAVAAADTSSIEILPAGAINFQTTTISLDDIHVFAPNGVPYTAKELSS